MLVLKMMLPLAFIAFVLISTVTSFAALGNPRLLHVSTSSIGRANDISSNNNFRQHHHYNNNINNSNNFLKQQHSLQYRRTHRYGLMFFNNKMFDEIDKKLDSVIEKQDGIQVHIVEKFGKMGKQFKKMDEKLSNCVMDVAVLQETCKGIDTKQDKSDKKQDFMQNTSNGFYFAVIAILLAPYLAHFAIK
jgi:hypothetical protein